MISGAICLCLSPPVCGVRPSALEEVARSPLSYAGVQSLFPRPSAFSVRIQDVHGRIRSKRAMCKINACNVNLSVFALAVMNDVYGSGSKPHGNYQSQVSSR